MTKYSKRIGGIIRVVRKSKGITLRQLASKTNMSVSMMSQTERGTSIPSIKTLNAVCIALEISQWMLHLLAEHGLDDKKTAVEWIKFWESFHTFLSKVRKDNAISPDLLPNNETSICTKKFI